MAGLRGNQASLWFGKQSGKGTPAATFLRTAFSGGSISPTRAVDQLSETDASRDAGDSYVQMTSAAGTPEVYGRDSNIYSLLEAAFGARASSAGPPVVEDITLASALPYFTFGKDIGGSLIEQYNDCMVNEITVSAEAGGPMTVSVDVVGRSGQRLAALPVGVPADLDTVEPVYNFNDAAVTLAGGATALVGSFEFTLTNNVTQQQTDDSVPYDVVPGLRVVTLGFDLIFETLDEYNKFHYGSAAGTTQVADLATTDASFTFTKDTDHEIVFDFPVIAYEEFPVEPDPGGDPIVASVRARAQRNAGGLVTAQVTHPA